MFESKLLIRNRKLWFLGLIIILFFPIYFLYYSQSDPESLEDQKKYEAGIISSIFNQFPEDQRDTSEGNEVYDLISEQSSLVNMQVYYLSQGKNTEAYIESGLRVNELRLEVHELGNKGIPDHLVMPKEEILKEDALLTYIQKHDIPLQPDTIVASNYLIVALNTFSGILFFIYVLISGSEILLYEQRHRTVVNGFPLSFNTKIHSKIMIHFLHTIIFLLIGLLVGGLYAAKEAGFGDFTYPVLIYQNGSYEAISTLSYLLHTLLAIAVITLMALYLSILLNMIFNNAYANVLIGLGIFLIPHLLVNIRVDSQLFHPLTYIDFANVLSGDLSVKLENAQIDYWHAIFWLVILILLILTIITVVNRFIYFKRKEANE
ncbi:hypothetical protein GMD78_17215 [Ornithinibacillus sp. L9]|uniref:ABC transporter permease n=1 Tax=Ornithinibacillus caprae TaxID=2678566 RepID=A0A6N8FKX7_9BACI|nr:hypothetical protein [Ornithinibacillus caprae]